MKGHVQIFDGDVLLHEDHNMIVDGAGEHIVDILTLSPDIGTDSDGDTINTNQKASDYQIKYASLGKSQKGYEENLHKYRQHNLIASGNHFEGLGTEVDITPVIGYHSIDTGGKAFKVTSLSGDGGYIEWTSRLDADFMAKLKKCPLVFSIDFKLDPNSQGSLLTGSAYGKQLSNRHLFSVLIESGDEKFEYTLSLQKPSEPTAGEVIGGVDDVLAGEVCYKRLGHGWHRMCATLPVKINLDGIGYSGNRSSDEFKIKLYPSYSKDLDPSDDGSDSTPDLTQGASLVGSMFLSRPSLNVGSLPINYYKGEERLTDETADNGRGYPKLWRTVANVAMTDDDCPYLEDLPGTLTNNSTSYNVIAELTENPTPEDTRLQTSSITSYEKSTDVVVNQGHNICVSKKLFLNNQLDPYAKDFIRDIVDNSWQFSYDYAEMRVQPDLRWFGCFADKWYGQANADLHFSKIEKGNEIYDFPQSTEIVDAMDVYGYIGRGTNTGSKFKLATTATDATLGKVVFTITIPAQDKKALNAFGGVFELGLSVVNVTETYKKQQKTLGQPINLNVAQVDVIRRLFCKKSFNFDITAGDKTIAFGNSNSVSDLVINWELDFGGTLQLS